MKKVRFILIFILPVLFLFEFSSTEEVNSSPTYEFWQGTSMATPHVTGLVALMLADGTPASSIRTILQSTATDLGPSGFDNEYGYLYFKDFFWRFMQTFGDTGFCYKIIITYPNPNPV